MCTHTVSTNQQQRIIGLKYSSVRKHQELLEQYLWIKWSNKLAAASWLYNTIPREEVIVQCSESRARARICVLVMRMAATNNVYTGCSEDKVLKTIWTTREWGMYRENEWMNKQNLGNFDIRQLQTMYIQDVRGQIAQDYLDYERVRNVSRKWMDE